MATLGTGRNTLKERFVHADLPSLHIFLNLVIGGRSRHERLKANVVAVAVGLGVDDAAGRFATFRHEGELGVVVGVWIGRSVRAERALRPILDAGQTLPAFVYLIPMLGFFGPSRFTAIATGIVYSIPIVVKIVGQGIREVPVNMVEAATSTGSTKWQLITKVQLPAAKKSLLLATNQGLIFVLAVVVIGGFVGGGGLGYLVLLGASKPELQGKGLVAGFCILLLGVMIDRIAQYMVARNSAPKH